MATQKRSVFLISGKVGDQVYVVRNGRNYVRSLPRKSTKPPTERQLTWRAKFILVRQFLTPLISLLNDSYARTNRKKSGLKVATQQVLEEAVTGVYPNLEINPSKVCLIRGSLPAPMAKMTYVPGSNELDFYWPLSSGEYHYAYDELGILIWCSSLNEFYSDLDSGVRRNQEFCTIPVPASFTGHEIHVWIFYRSTDHRSYSRSVYMGRVNSH